MKWWTKSIVAVLTVLAGAVVVGVRIAANRATADSRFHGSANLRVFDPARDAFADLRQAEAQAAAEHKNILMDVGGNWCPSCILFDRTLRSDGRLRDLLNNDYLVLHVNWSSDNKNERVLKPLPSPRGYPMVYVLGPNGGLLVAQETSVVEDASPGSDGYDHRSLEHFLLKY